MQDLEKIKKINDLAKSFKDSGLAKDMEEAINMAEKSLSKGEDPISELRQSTEKGFFGKLKEKIIPSKEGEEKISEEDEEKIDEVLKEAGVGEEIREEDKEKVDEVPKEVGVETEDKVDDVPKETGIESEEEAEKEDITEESEEKEKIIRTEEEESEEEEEA